MIPTNTHILFHEFDWHEPTHTQEVLALLAAYGKEAALMAGGTDLLVQMKMERRKPSRVISLRRIRTLDGITENSGITIGATTQVRTLYHSVLLKNKYHALTEAANWFSTVQIMYMATVGGNLCNASPAADTAPPLLVFDASARIASNTGERSVPLSRFFVGPGKTVLTDGELLTQIELPPPRAHTGSAFIKISRVAADISQVCAAAKIVRDKSRIAEARIALGSVAPTPVRAEQAEQILLGEIFSPALAEEAGKIAAAEIKPISDVRATLEYRRHVARVIVRDALLKAWERAA